MSTPALPLPSLADAITAAEAGEANLANATNQTATDQGLADAIQVKLTAAQGVITQDQAAQQSANTADIQALTTLDQVIQARIAALTPPTAPPAV